MARSKQLDADLTLYFDQYEIPVEQSPWYGKATPGAWVWWVLQDSTKRLLLVGQPVGFGQFSEVYWEEATRIAEALLPALKKALAPKT